MAIENWGYAAATPAAGTAATTAAVKPSGLDTFAKKLGITTDELIAKYGKAPDGGWTDENVYQTLKPDTAPRAEGDWVTPYNYGSANTDLQGWLKDPSLLEGLNLYGSGSKEDLERGFNILQYMAPRTIGEFWGLSPEVQKAILSNPSKSLPQMQAMANPANGDWLSVGAEGGFSDLGAYQTDGTNIGADPSKYMQVHDGEDFGILQPIAQIASIVPGPWQPIAIAANAAMQVANNNPLGAILSAAGAAIPNMGGQLGANITGGAATDLTSKLVGNGLIGSMQGFATGNAGKGALMGAIGTGISEAVGTANPVAKDDIAGQVLNGVASNGLKTVATGLINSQSDKQTATNTNTSTADTSGGTRVEAPKFTAFRPTKIEKWGYA